MPGVLGLSPGSSAPTVMTKGEGCAGTAAGLELPLTPAAEQRWTERVDKEETGCWAKEFGVPLTWFDTCQGHLMVFWKHILFLSLVRFYNDKYIRPIFKILC